MPAPTPVQELGSDYRIFVSDGATPPNFTSIAGETQFDWQRQSKEIDGSTKDDGVYGSTGFGQQTLTFDVSGMLKLPDPGLTRVNSVAKSSPPNVVMRVMKGNIKKYEGLVAIGNFSTTHQRDENVTWKFTAKNVGAPTVDALDATQ